MIDPGRAPIRLGLYGGDFVYYSLDDEVEKEFEKQLKSKTLVDFMGPVAHFLGHKFQWKRYETQDTQHLKVHLFQSAYADHLQEIAGLSQTPKTVKSPYRQGFPVDDVLDTPPNPDRKPFLQNHMREMVASLNWFSQGTRPDLSTITSMLARYQNDPNEGHITAAKYAIRYVTQTRHLGIIFGSGYTNKFHSYTQFPLDPLHALTDENWGPQDQSTVTQH